MTRVMIILLVGIVAGGGIVQAEQLFGNVWEQPGFYELPPAEQQRMRNEAIKREGEAFDLYTNCEPVGVLVESLTDDGKKLGLTKDDIQMTVESRLRAARLYPTAKQFAELIPNIPILYVRIHVGNAAFVVNLELGKQVLDEYYSGYGGRAYTWRTGRAGIYENGGSGANYLLGLLAMDMDKFIVDYLRVNEKAC